MTPQPKQKYFKDRHGKLITTVPREFRAVAANMKAYVRLVVTSFVMNDDNASWENLNNDKTANAALILEITAKTERIYARVMKLVSHAYAAGILRPDCVAASLFPSLIFFPRTFFVRR